MVPDELRSLYPGLSDEEILVVKENIDRYLLLAWEIMKEAQNHLDGNDAASYDECKGRFPKNPNPSTI